MGPIGKQADHAIASPSSERIQPPRNPSTMTTRPNPLPALWKTPGLLRQPAAAGLVVLAGLARSIGRQSGRNAEPPHRRLEPALPAADAGGDAVAAAEWLELAAEVPADAGPVCVFLCVPAPWRVPDLRPILRSSGHSRRHRQAPLHHGRLRRFPAANPVGRDVHQRHDQTAGPQLAALAPAGLPDRYAGRGALLVAGQGRHQ
jgi:hypothetical protein